MHKVHTMKSFTSGKGQPQFISKLSCCQEEQEKMNGYAAASVHELRTNGFREAMLFAIVRPQRTFSQEASNK